MRPFSTPVWLRVAVGSRGNPTRRIYPNAHYRPAYLRAYKYRFSAFGDLADRIRIYVVRIPLGRIRYCIGRCVCAPRLFRRRGNRPTRVPTKYGPDAPEWEFRFDGRPVRRGGGGTFISSVFGTDPVTRTYYDARPDRSKTDGPAAG